MTEGKNNLFTTHLDYFIPILEIYYFREAAVTCMWRTVGDTAHTHQRCVRERACP